MTGQVHGEKKNLTRAIKYKATKPGSGNPCKLGVSEVLLYMLSVPILFLKMSVVPI